MAISDTPEIGPTTDSDVHVQHQEVRGAKIEDGEVAKQVDLKGAAESASLRRDEQKRGEARGQVVGVEEVKHHRLELGGHMDGQQHGPAREAEEASLPAPAVQEVSESEEPVVPERNQHRRHVRRSVLRRQPAYS